MAHNMTYHHILKRTPTELPHGRIPYNALDLKFGSPLQNNRNKVQLRTLIDEVNRKYKDTIVNILEAFHKYKNHYNRETSAQLLEIGDFVFLLNLEYHKHSDKTQFKMFFWNGTYKVTKKLTLSNYIIRKTCTHKTKCVKRLHLQNSLHTKMSLPIRWIKTCFSKTFTLLTSLISFQPTSRQTQLVRINIQTKNLTNTWKNFEKSWHRYNHHQVNHQLQFLTR